MVEDLDRQIRELQRDTRYREVIVAAVVVGIIAGVAGGALLPAYYPWLVNPGRGTGLLGCFLLPFAICYGLGHVMYRLLRLRLR